ncbi:hypothetical protein ACFL35_19905 [Candidatus Riflebacteria bacterium]
MFDRAYKNIDHAALKQFFKTISAIFNNGKKKGIFKKEIPTSKLTIFFWTLLYSIYTYEKFYLKNCTEKSFIKLADSYFDIFLSGVSN